jgi:uncharacterized repeat protein (TIGR01451 family)
LLYNAEIMNIRALFATLCVASWVLALASIAPAQDLPNPLAVRSIAEVESRAVVAGREVVKLIPADRLVPGDRVLYTLEVRNLSTSPQEAPTVSQPVPEHTQYVADSAVGPGAAVTYSVDGGRTFDRPENLKVPAPDGAVRPAIAADYTDIRWQLKISLKPNSVAFVRFRAVVK